MEKKHFVCSFSGLIFKGKPTKQNNTIYYCETERCPYRPDYQPLAIMGPDAFTHYPNLRYSYRTTFMKPVNHNFNQEGVGFIGNIESQEEYEKSFREYLEKIKNR